MKHLVKKFEVSVKITGGTANEFGVKVWQVPSFSTPGKLYEVRYVPGRGYICNCPFFLARHLRCDHIRKVAHKKLKYH